MPLEDAMMKQTHTTPMMAQYMSVKSEYPDAILFFRMGDFYETFYQDAEIASRVLGIALTSRSKEGERKIPLAGVPYHAADTYIARLVRAGYKVAICEQVEDAKLAKGLVKRKVVEVITPGTVTSSLLLEDKENNFIAAIGGSKERWAIARADLSTGDFTVAEGTLREILEEIAKTTPSEVLIPKGEIDEAIITRFRQLSPKAFITELDEWLFLPESAEAILKDHFGVSSLEGFGCSGLPLAIGAAGALITYLRQTQKRVLPHLASLKVHQKSQFMEIDEDSFLNLEILKPLHAEDEGACLTNVIDRTLTAMGGRKLRAWIKNPSINREEIILRHEAVEDLLIDEIRRKDLRSILRNARDIERLQARVCCEKAGPRDLIAIRDTLRLLPEIKKIISGAGSRIIASIERDLPDLSDIEDLISHAIADDAPAIFKPGVVIKPGYDPRLDELRKTSGSAKQWILELQAHEREKTGISNLKIGYNKVFGYYIEVSRSNLKSVPPHYIRKQTLVGAERFITEELKQKEIEILKAEEVAAEMEERIFKEVRSRIALEVKRIQKVADMLAHLDVLAAFAEVASDNDYVRPEIVESPGIEIRDGRHPVVEQFLSDEQFVPNDVELNPENQILIITGPNMAGKSTFLRQVALIVIMAQVGSFVPAASARIGIVDKIFTRIGAADRVARGQSTFLVEMIETAKILNNATRQSLVLLDEVGRGTSTFDGLSIAWAVVEYLHDHEERRPMTLFATHYHELTDLAGVLPRVKNFNVLVKEYGDHVVFLRKIVEGGCDRSYGIHVAKLAGLPESVIERAKEILKNLEEDEFSVGDIPRLARGKHSPIGGDIQLNLWDSERELTERLKEIDIENLTPLEALKKLAELKELAEGTRKGEDGEDKGTP